MNVSIVVLLFVFHVLESAAAFQLQNIAPPPTALGDGCGTTGFRNRRTLSHSLLCANAGGDMESSPKQLPKAIIFDLDGCLWSPEMYEIMYFMGGQGAPFREDPNNSPNLLTSGGRPVKLLGDVRSVFEEMHTQPCYGDTQIGISSRTDEPNWARELLEKFKIAAHENGKPVCIADVLNGPIEIAQDSKVAHFERIRSATGIDYKDMVFFDNEFGNCERVSSLGVSVVYCPKGVTRKLWERGVRLEFPSSDGSVING
jgi:magnesium-dependent phosphatase 1